MAVINVTRLQVRRGHKADMPQLSSAEFGWAIDAQKLYVGNGSLSEGAPTVGNTEILTEHSDLLNLHSYTVPPNPLDPILVDTTGPLTELSFTVPTAHYQELKYSVRRGNDARGGVLHVTASPTGAALNDDYTIVNTDCGISFSVAIDIPTQIVTVSYTILAGADSVKMTFSPTLMP